MNGLVDQFKNNPRKKFSHEFNNKDLDGNVKKRQQSRPLNNMCMSDDQYIHKMPPE